jgi:hypothetical protein
VAILWLLVWLIFFRTTGKVVTPHKPATTQSQSAKSGTSSHKQSKPSGTAASGSQGQVNAPGQSAVVTPGATGTTPQQLANTGPGDVLLPVAAASAAGIALSYVRLRKKLANGA